MTQNSYSKEAEALLETHATEDTALDKTDLKRLDLPIQGMSCASCVAKIEGALALEAKGQRAWTDDSSDILTPFLAKGGKW